MREGSVRNAVKRWFCARTRGPAIRYGNVMGADIRRLIEWDIRTYMNQ